MVLVAALPDAGDGANVMGSTQIRSEFIGGTGLGIKSSRFAVTHMRHVKTTQEANAGEGNPKHCVHRFEDSRRRRWI